MGFPSFRKLLSNRLTLSWWLAHRFYHNGAQKGKGSAGSLAVQIATVGVAVGLIVMLISIAVVKGFQNEVSDKLCGFASHITILNDSSFVSPDSYPIFVNENLIESLEKVPGVKHVGRTSQKMGILKTDSAYQTISLKGIAQDYDISFIHRHLEEGTLPQFSDSVSSGQVLVSRLIADNLGLKVGSSVFAYFFEEQVKARKFKVAAIYNTYLSQFDQYVVLTDLHTTQKLNKWDEGQISTLEVEVNDFEHLDAVHVDVGALLNRVSHDYGTFYHHLSVKENPQTAGVFSWLEVLNLNILVILTLMICVAGFTMISGLLILILERTQTIGLLKAMGATNWRIRSTFISYATLIVGRGMLIGNFVALLVLFVQYKWEFFKLDPVNYYVPYVPVSFEWGAFLALNVITLFACVLSLIVPSFLVSKIQPAKVIQFD